jgi:hypothetical protein
LLINPSFIASIPVLKHAPSKNFLEKTANAVEGKVYPDRFSAVVCCLMSFSRVSQKDTDSHFRDSMIAPKPQETPKKPRLHTRPVTVIAQ